MSQRILVVGAGFSGAVVARELADAGFDVTVMDQRDHVAGNAFDFVTDVGIRVHRYGPHLFHTSNARVVEWLSRFREWVPYRHRVKALLADGRYVTLPVNRETTAVVGPDRVLDVLFRPYTRKMWSAEMEAIDPDILQRVPIRDDLNEEYFPNDTFQALPVNGYTALIARVLDHARIELVLSQTFTQPLEAGFAHVFTSMPIDEYFGYSLGRLPYRSIRFHSYTLPVPRLLPVATVNFTHDAPYTRVTEWKLLPGHGENEGLTTITVEEPCSDEDNNYEQYYPVKDRDGVNRRLYARYASMAPSHVTFIGRCGLYAYLDMHQAVTSALAVSAVFLADRSSPGRHAS